MSAEPDSLPRFAEANKGPERRAPHGGDGRDPSLAQIAERTAAIRECWDDREFYVRGGHRVPPEHADADDFTRGLEAAWTAPTCSIQTDV